MTNIHDVVLQIKDKMLKKELSNCTAPQKLDIKNLTFGVFFNEINL